MKKHCFRLKNEDINIQGTKTVIVRRGSDKSVHDLKFDLTKLQHISNSHLFFTVVRTTKLIFT